MPRFIGANFETTRHSEFSAVKEEPVAKGVTRLQKDRNLSSKAVGRNRVGCCLREWRPLSSGKQMEKQEAPHV